MMAEPTSPSEDAADDAGAVRNPVAHDAIQRNTEGSAADARSTDDDTSTETARYGMPASTGSDATAAGASPTRAGSDDDGPVRRGTALEERRQSVEQPRPPAEEQPVVAPTAMTVPPPRRKGNRIVGTAWVLLGAGLFELLFFVVNALIVFAFGGAPAVAPQLKLIAATPLVWLPVVLFFLLFELTVLLVNRAGRFTFVLASLIVGAIVYAATVLLYSLITQHALGDANTLAQYFLNYEFILIGLVAREVMLWTGLAIGARGVRVRGRNKDAKRRYDEELAAAGE